MKILYSEKPIGRYTIGLPVAIWFGATMLAALLEMSRGVGEINNFLIYRGVYEHTIQQVNLYLTYPSEYSDSNHYGPLFSILIAPFTWLPLFLGCTLWCLANCWVLYYAIKKLNLSKTQFYTVLLISCIEQMTATHSVQFNTMLTGFMLLSYAYIKDNKISAATLLIAAGFLIKLYSIVGLVLFLFTDKKITFVISFILWVIVLFALPMLISSPEFIIQSYRDWFHSLVEKNGTNIDISIASGMQDISVGGMVRRIFNLHNLPNYFITIPAGLLILFPLLRFKQFRSEQFTLTYYCMLLISVVIFSSSAESPTYIIAVTGIAIWFAIQQELNKKQIALLIFLFLFTILSPTDLFPKAIRDGFFVKYSLKALPCFIAWLTIIATLITKSYSLSQPVYAHEKKN
jgi:hypothetical protein